MIKQVFRKVLQWSATALLFGSAMTVQAQSTCAAFQPVTNGALDGTATGHAGSGNTPGWTASGSSSDGWARNTVAGVMLIDDNGGTSVTVPTTADTLSQTVSGVAPSSVVTLTLSWGNGGSASQTNNGNQARLQLIYNGVVYAQFLTAPFGPALSYAAPGPTGGSFTALNGASIAMTSGTWLPFSGTTFTVTLPAGLAATGALTLSGQRMENGVGATSGATDDFYLNDIQVDTTTLCLVKTTVGGTGTFGFTMGSAFDSGIDSAGVQSTASITTAAANSPVAYDASSGLTGVQPMLVVNPGSTTGTTIVESTLATNFSLSGATCSNGVSAGISGATVTLGAIPARADVTCTLTNTFAPPPLGTCPAEAYITRGATGSTVRLYTLGLANGVMTDQGTSPAMENSINAIGFRQQDGYIWGWNNVTDRLVRVGAGGVADSPYSTPPTGLPVGVDFYTADVSQAGIYVGMETNRLWFIDVTTNAVIGGPIALSGGIGSDMAYSPIDGNLYSVRSTDGAVLRISPTTGLVTPIGISLPIGGSGGFGGVFFDNQGTFYAYKSDSAAGPGMIYRVFNPDGSGTLAYDLLSSSLTASSLDGARCPLAPPQGAPAILLRKITLGGTGGGGPFNFTLNNTVQTTGTATTTAVNTPVQVDGDSTAAGTQSFTVLNSQLGQPLTINESSLPATWSLTNAVCRRDGAVVGSLLATTYTVPGTSVVSGALIECDFTNSRVVSDLIITKTNTPGVGPLDQATDTLTSGSATSYRIVVTNNGPDTVANAVFRDPPPTGVVITGVTCTASAGATCPAAASLTVANMQSAAGIAIPSLANGGSVTFTLSGTVN